MTRVELLGVLFFALAVLHTFFTSVIRRWEHGLPPSRTSLKAVLALLGEVEVVFGFWATLWIGGCFALQGELATVAHLNQLRFSEPLFVFAIMTLAATRPVIQAAGALLDACGRGLKRLGLPAAPSVLFLALTAGPLLGSVITEPAAMTITALFLRERFFSRSISRQFRHALLAVLFVNISIGGVLTPFAAPPVLMVAHRWGWDLRWMWQHFAGRALAAVVFNSALILIVFFRELPRLRMTDAEVQSRLRRMGQNAPIWLTIMHLLLLAGCVYFSHEPVLFLGIFLIFLGLVTLTPHHQEKLRIKESLMVAFFLGGLVVLGSVQGVWLKPLLERLDDFSLFLGAAGLTAFTDNAALTYLGTQVSGLSERARFALVAGAVGGGGLTVIANAPNPAGYAIVADSMGQRGLSPLLLLSFALIPTAVSLFFLWI